MDPGPSASRRPPDRAARAGPLIAAYATQICARSAFVVVFRCAGSPTQSRLAPPLRGRNLDLAASLGSALRRRQGSAITGLDSPGRPHLLAFPRYFDDRRSASRPSVCGRQLRFQAPRARASPNRRASSSLERPVGWGRGSSAESEFRHRFSVFRESSCRELVRLLRIAFHRPRPFSARNFPLGSQFPFATR
jgi:hypothetical protein